MKNIQKHEFNVAHDTFDLKHVPRARQACQISQPTTTRGTRMNSGSGFTTNKRKEAVDQPRCLLISFDKELFRSLEHFALACGHFTFPFSFIKALQTQNIYIIYRLLLSQIIYYLRN